MSSSYLVPRGVITTPSYICQQLNIAAEVRIKSIRRHHAWYLLNPFLHCVILASFLRGFAHLAFKTTISYPLLKPCFTTTPSWSTIPKSFSLSLLPQGRYQIVTWWKGMWNLSIKLWENLSLYLNPLILTCSTLLVPCKDSCGLGSALEPLRVLLAHIQQLKLALKNYTTSINPCLGRSYMQNKGRKCYFHMEDAYLLSIRYHIVGEEIPATPPNSLVGQPVHK